jgi:hypothetical protein
MAITCLVTLRMRLRTFFFSPPDDMIRDSA